MTTLGLRRGGGTDARNVLVVALFAAWAIAVIGFAVGVISMSGKLPLVLTLGVPPLAVGLALLARSEIAALPVVAGASCAVALAVLLPPIAAERPAFAFAFPAMAIGGALTQRFPAASLGTVFAVTGTYGSLTAFTGFPVVSIGEAVLGGLWVGIIGRLVIGRRPMALRPTPALLLMTAFFVLTLAAVLATTPFGAGIRAFRLAPLYLSALLLLGYGAFRQQTLDRLARCMIVVALVVAAYAALRWGIGASPKERALQSTDLDRQYNQLAVTGDVKVQGSLPNGNLLGLWMAVTIPFLVAIVLSWRGRYRLVAAVALPLSLVALLGSAQRTGAAAAVAGALIVVIVHMLSRCFRGPRLGVAVAAVLTVTISAAVVYPAVIDNPEKRKRYSNILTPEQDVPFQERVLKWNDTLAALKGHPFGFGMGAGNGSAIPHRFADISNLAIDNSYLMIAYDQGIVVMAFFVLTLFVLLFELLRHAVWTRGPGGAALATAAAGTLVAILVEFMSANYVATRPIIAGWMIVGLGVAQFGSRRPGAAAEPQRALAP
jgi:hypothetical protein